MNLQELHISQAVLNLIDQTITRFDLPLYRPVSESIIPELHPNLQARLKILLNDYSFFGYNLRSSDFRDVARASALGFCSGLELASLSPQLTNRLKEQLAFPEEFVGALTGILQAIFEENWIEEVGARVVEAFKFLLTRTRTDSTYEALGDWWLFCVAVGIKTFESGLLHGGEILHSNATKESGSRIYLVQRLAGCLYNDLEWEQTHPLLKFIALNYQGTPQEGNLIYLGFSELINNHELLPREDLVFWIRHGYEFGRRAAETEGLLETLLREQTQHYGDTKVGFLRKLYSNRVGPDSSKWDLDAVVNGAFDWHRDTYPKFLDVDHLSFRIGTIRELYDFAIWAGLFQGSVESEKSK
jgi:hypothetical protein